MDRLAPTITDPPLLALLGSVLANDSTHQSTSGLRLRFFQPGFSWQALVDLAVAHEVFPAFVFSLSKKSLLPPVPSSFDDKARKGHVTNRLLAAYQEHVDRQADLRKQLEAALRALNKEQIVPVVLKGAVHLTLPQSEWHQARGMRDLDILVPETKAEKANRILLSLGYHADHDPPPLDRHLPELRLANRAGAVEIHTEALSFPARYALTTEEVFARAERRSYAGVTFCALPIEWHLLHGVLHHQLADHGHGRRMLALKGLWEFYRAGADLSPSGWHAIIEHSERHKLLDMLSSWSVQANILFGLEAPDMLLSLESGRRHANATFRRARSSHGLRQALFVADKLRFAFAPATLALRYKQSGSAGGAALRHLGFLWRRRGRMLRGWVGR